MVMQLNLNFRIGMNFSVEKMRMMFGGLNSPRTQTHMGEEDRKGLKGPRVQQALNHHPLSQLEEVLEAMPFLLGLCLCPSLRIHHRLFAEISEEL